MRHPDTTAKEALNSVVQRRGYALINGVLDRCSLKSLTCAIENFVPEVQRGGMRNLLAKSVDIATLASSQPIRKLVEIALGRPAFPVRALLFDKSPEINWGVSWHQDLAIPLQRRIDMEGFGPWSMKHGVPHAFAPTEVLANMMSLRLHLDDATEANGALSVLPGTHRLGRLSDNAAKSLAKNRQPVLCPAGAGDILLMRPLLIHSSRKGTSPSRRRVIHIEYAAHQLPAPLLWQQT